ncbi:MAG TPA: DUF2293 domain-containing protein [Prolixibacteraceae bacterium]|nr:DUF2293 domain-containing protein [Prolixibacteraceae bacterium]
MEQIRIVKPGAEGKLTGEKGEPLTPPSGWTYLPAGDAGVTRKVTSKGQYWRVEIKKGRRTMSLGIWAPKATIENAVKEMQQTRQSDQYQKKLSYAAGYREKKQTQYQDEFLQAIKDFLGFHPSYKEMEHQLAVAVTAHAIPVGSGTVARTQMIPIEKRAQLAVIAWMRHQTTAYDHLSIARIKGERSAVRRTLAQQSESVLMRYRQGMALQTGCPLKKALEQKEKDE